MTREPWMQSAEERGSLRRISGGDRTQSIVSGNLAIRMGSKSELHGSGRALQQPELSQQEGAMSVGVLNTSKRPTSFRRGSMLGSLKAHYRKLRTFKGTVRALISLRRTPLSLSSVAKAAPSVSSVSEDQRSAALDVRRISATATSTVQSQVQKLVADGHVVAEIDPTAGLEVTYRQQGNLDHYTEDNLAKRVSLQQHLHMIALTQRLWNCALHNGAKKLKYADYETYMLCLHRLILPEFDIAASKELIKDDWKRDSGEQDSLDYAFFHLSMFELVDLWTDTVDSEDYISLLYCITHCLTYLLNEGHMLKPLEDISNVDILQESKGVTLESIKQDLQRELNSESFTYYRDQVKLATEANQTAERAIAGPATGSPRQAVQRGITGPSSPRRESQSQQGNRSRSRDRKRSSSSNSESENLHGGTPRDVASQHRRSRSGSGAFGQDSPKRKFSVQANTKALNVTANVPGSDITFGGSSSPTAHSHSIGTSPLSPRRESPRRESATEKFQRAISPNVFSRGGGVILNIGTMDGMTISKPIADGKSFVAVSTTGNAAFPRRRSRSASHSSQQRRDQASKVDNTRDAGLQVGHIEATGSILRTASQDPNAPGYLLLASASSGKYHGPFTVRAAAVAQAAANMAIAAAPPVSPRQSMSLHRTQYQMHQRTLQSNQDGVASVAGGATNNIPPNLFTNKSSLTAPLMTIVSSKTPTPHDANSSYTKIQLQFQDNLDPRPPSPHGGLLLSSPRASNAITAQAAGIFISSQRLPTSPRPTLFATQRPGSILTSEHQTPRKFQQREESLSFVATGPGTSTNPIGLAVSGRTAQSNGIEAPTVQRQASKSESTTGDSALASFSTSDGLSPPMNDLKALLSPRYVVAHPTANHPAPNLKQSSIRPQGSSRGFAGMQNSPRVRHQPSKLVTGPAANHLRQQRHPSELLGLAIAPGKF